MAAVFVLLYMVSEVLSTAVVTLPDVKLGDPVTLPCKHHDLEDTPVDQLDVKWLLGEQLVSRLDRGQISFGINYRNRTEIPVGGARHGNFSLTIKHTQHGDGGVYRCVIRRENQEDTLGEAELTVEVPRSPSTVFVKVGEEVVLPCFGRVDWLDSEAELVRWKKGTWVVLEWVQGSLYVDPEVKGRASLPKEEIHKDNLSLVLKNTHHEDQGLYLCSYVKDSSITPAAQINLTVTDHLSQMKALPGSSVLLSLHIESAVSVWFLPDGGNDTVCVCEVEQGQMKCDAAYTHRTGLHNGSLELKDLSMLDSGTFLVMKRGSRRTVSVVHIEVLSTGDLEESDRTRSRMGIFASLCLLLIFIAVIGLKPLCNIQLFENKKTEDLPLSPF